MKYLNILILFALVGCKSMSVSEASKTLIKKGNQQGTDFVEYSIVLNSEEEFNVTNIYIEGGKEEIKFYYKDLKTGLSSYKMMSPFPKGNYSFNFKLNNLQNFSKEEFLIIELTVKGKEKSKRIKIEQKENKILRS